MYQLIDTFMDHLKRPTPLFLLQSATYVVILILLIIELTTNWLHGSPNQYIAVGVVAVLFALIGYKKKQLQAKINQTKDALKK